MNKKVKVSIFLGILLTSFFVWRTLVSFMPPRLSEERHKVHEANETLAKLADLDQSLQQLDLRFGDLQSKFNDLQDHVEETNRNILVPSKDVARVVDLERRYSTLRERVTDELKEVKSLTGTLRDLTGKVGDGKVYQVSLQNYQQRLDARLAAFEAQDLQARTVVHDRLDEWGSTLSLFAAILAIMMTAITGLAALVLYFEIQPQSKSGAHGNP
ncbi:MAG TPA: hypothetical protein VHU83_03640 [Bryobacteraceae bacterium]|nr:hypothetical protein [Bryobacteraceae bacterium]